MANHDRQRASATPADIERNRWPASIGIRWPTSSGMPGRIHRNPQFVAVHHIERVNRLVGSNRLAGDAALAAARELGYVGRYLGDDWQGEAQVAGRRFAEAVLASRGSGKTCVVAGGETTVRVRVFTKSMTGCAAQR